MNQAGPVIFTTLYTGGVLLTILLAMMFARLGEAVPRALLAVLQIVITSIAILSAWALQNKKRSDDAKDAADAAADGALAIIFSINDQAAWFTHLVETGKASKALYGMQAGFIDEELKALASIPLATLKPSAAAVAVVQYRMFARHFVATVKAAADDDTDDSWMDLFATKLNDIRGAEREFFRCLEREIPGRLIDLPTNDAVREKYRDWPRATSAA